MKASLRLLVLFLSGLLTLTLCLALAQPLVADGIPPDPQIPLRHMISPEELSQLLKTQQPLVLQVGPRTLYDQAHITGAEYVGATSEPEGLNALLTRVKSEPKNKLIVVYCGCCPWKNCPNVHPAYRELRNLGYTNVRVLYVAHNLGVDWVDKGYPTTKG